MMRVSTKERAHGQWRFILPRLGIDPSYLTGRHCPCPLCGGTNRFRFIDRGGRDGDGMWLCNQCTPHPRPAIELAMKFTGKLFKDVAREIDIILGDDRKPPPPARPKTGDARVLPPSAHAM